MVLEIKRLVERRRCLYHEFTPWQPPTTHSEFPFDVLKKSNLRERTFGRMLWQHGRLSVYWLVLLGRGREVRGGRGVLWASGGSQAARTLLWIQPFNIEVFQGLKENCQWQKGRGYVNFTFAQGDVWKCHLVLRAWLSQAQQLALVPNRGSEFS